MKNILKPILIMALLFLFSCSSSDKPVNLVFNNVEELQSYFTWTEPGEAIISAHRGGSYPGYPENCIETFDYILKNIPAMLEIDVSMTKDSVLVLMHDYTLERTSTGNGRISDKTYEELQQYYLEDLEGNATEFRIPTFSDALAWTKGKTVLNIDIKRGVPFSMIMDAVHEADALGSVFVIVYNLQDARSFLELDPKVLLSVSLRSIDEIRRANDMQIPLDQVYAFTGTRLNEKALYDTLHTLGIYCNLGTLGNMDRMAAAKSDSLYTYWRDTYGVDIFATDRPLEVAREFNK